MDNQEITNSEMVDMVLNGSYPEVAKQMARYAKLLEESLKEIENKLDEHSTIHKGFPLYMRVKGIVDNYSALSKLYEQMSVEYKKCQEYLYDVNNGLLEMPPLMQLLKEQVDYYEGVIDEQATIESELSKYLDYARDWAKAWKASAKYNRKELQETKVFNFGLAQEAFEANELVSGLLGKIGRKDSALIKAQWALRMLSKSTDERVLDAIKSVNEAIG
jgi:hypothetical protein